MRDPHTAGMAAVGLTASAASAFAPRLFFRLFGVPEVEVTGAARLGWRLFAVRTATISVLALRGNETATAAFLPVQVMDQATWWWGYRRGELSLRTAAMAAMASSAIIGLDVARRAAIAAGGGPVPGPGITRP